MDISTSEIWAVIGFFIVAFIIGSTPFGLIIGKAKGVDIRELGSKNIGATNVGRNLGKKFGFLCFFLDGLKGWIPTYIAKQLWVIEGRDPIPLSLPEGLITPPFMVTEADAWWAQLIPIVVGLLTILGHNYSIWLKFKGGKGIASSFGVLLALMPVGIACILVIWMITLLISRYVSVASIVAAVALPIMTHIGARLHGRWEDGTWNKPLFILSLILAFLAVWRHRTNIVRLLAGTEEPIKLKKKVNTNH